MSVNKVILIGNVGRDPDIRYTGPGQAVATFSFATHERGYTNQAGVAIPEKTEWHNIVMWGKHAEIAERYIRKGTMLYIEGKLRTRTWEDKNQIKRNITEIYVENFDIISRSNPSAQQTSPQS